MAQNRVKKSNPGLEFGVSDMDGKAKSGNLEAGAAYAAPLKNNAKRPALHLGAMPKPGSGKF